MRDKGSQYRVVQGGPLDLAASIVFGLFGGCEIPLLTSKKLVPIHKFKLFSVPGAPLLSRPPDRILPSPGR